MVSNDSGDVEKPGTGVNNNDSQDDVYEIPVARSLNRLTVQLASNEDEQERSERKTRFREWLTICLLAATVIFTGGAARPSPGR
jgi:hypothetical protein